MKKKKRIVFLEIIILIIIVMSLITITLLAISYFKNKVDSSTSNEIENYSHSKVTMYYADLKDIEKYKIPYISSVDPEKSFYKVFIKSTDNYIKGYSEIISINYIAPVEEKKIKKFCNSYNLIEHDYYFSCKNTATTLYIRNDISLPIDLIKKNDYPLLFSNEQKLSDYLKILDEKNIKYSIVSEIK